MAYEPSASPFQSSTWFLKVDGKVACDYVSPFRITICIVVPAIGYCCSFVSGADSSSHDSPSSS
eukprot:9686392-Prorocentrum_lima.AAC.1